MLNRKTSIIGGLIVLFALGFYWHHRRAAQIDRLYQTAARGRPEAQAAVRDLGSYSGRSVDEMLSQIALGKTSFVAEHIQSEAVREVAKRNVPGIAAQLAAVLVPHESIVTRQAVAEALNELECNDDCIRAVLHYLERIWHGEPNTEDQALSMVRRLPELSKRIDRMEADVQDRQQRLYTALYRVLKRNPVATVQVLIRTYSIRSDVPSPFAIDIVGRLKLREACSSLLESERLIDASVPESKPPNLVSALDAAGCR